MLASPTMPIFFNIPVLWSYLSMHRSCVVREVVRVPVVSLLLHELEGALDRVQSRERLVRREERDGVPEPLKLCAAAVGGG